MMAAKPTLVYMVYRREAPSGATYRGLSTTGSVRTAIHVKDGGYTTKSVSLTQLPHYLADLARKGYRLQDKEMFFNDTTCDFTRKHPDFEAQIKGSNYVLFAEPEDLDEAFVLMDKLALDHSFTAQLNKERDWMNSQMQNNTFLVAMNTTPLWALIVAELAVTYGWPITASRSGCPTSKPSQKPIDWHQWLQHFFASETISQVQMALGWTAAKLLETTTTNNTAPAGMLAVDYL